MSVLGHAVTSHESVFRKYLPQCLAFYFAVRLFTEIKKIIIIVLFAGEMCKAYGYLGKYLTCNSFKHVIKYQNAATFVKFVILNLQKQIRKKQLQQNKTT